MAELENGKPVSLEDFMVVSTVAMTDAFTKLLIEKASRTRSSSRRCWRSVRCIGAF
jgi:hypothetical protein